MRVLHKSIRFSRGLGYLWVVAIDSQNIVSRYLQRRVLLLSLVLLALLFAVTASLARSYHARETGLAAEWQRAGNADLAKGKPTLAIDDFRNSLSYGPDDPDVQMRLAEALLADGRYTESLSYLANLWSQSPGSGPLNLDLARVSIQMGDVNQAIRYFHGAIFGSWDTNPALERRKVRLELCEFLLAHRRTSDAQAEIAGLAADTPSEDGPLREEDGRLFLRAGEQGDALTEFEAAIRIDPRQSQWLVEAAQAAFEKGEFQKAETYFERSDHLSTSPAVHASLLLVRDVLGNDPYLAGLSDEEQARRSWRDFRQGLDRLRDCDGSGIAKLSSSSPAQDLQQLTKDAQDLQKRVNPALLARDPETRDEAMRFVFRVEDATAKVCGPGTGFDQALKLIEARHEDGNS
jgi:tetratricopeptide (TPR) repeat protein